MAGIEPEGIGPGSQDWLGLNKKGLAQDIRIGWDWLRLNKKRLAQDLSVVDIETKAGRALKACVKGLGRIYDPYMALNPILILDAWDRLGRSQDPDSERSGLGSQIMGQYYPGFQG